MKKQTNLDDCGGGDEKGTGTSKSCDPVVTTTKNGRIKMVVRKESKGKSAVTKESKGKSDKRKYAVSKAMPDFKKAEKGSSSGSGSGLASDLRSGKVKDLGKTLRGLCKDITDYAEDSDSSDISWHDSDEDDEAIETDDSLDDGELGSGDEEEYQEAKQNSRQEEGIIGEIEENGDGFGGCWLENEVREEMHSDYVDSDAEMNSDSSEHEDDFQPKTRKFKVRYDPKCNHKEMELSVGMRFHDGFQCREALKS